MNDAFEDVKAFHVAFGVPAPDSPQFSPRDRVQRRAEWIKSELVELRIAPNMVEQADAYIDIIYFALGGLVEMGIYPASLFRIVHAANMAKIWPDGKPRFREDTKILKPPGWIDPNDALAADILRQELERP